MDLADGSVQALVLERHAPSRIGFGLLLRSQAWVSRCLLAEDRETAVEITRRIKPDVVIVDISDAGPFLTSYLAPLRAAHTAMSLLLSTRESGPAAARLPVTGGALGLLSADQTADEVLEAVRLAVLGERVPRAASDPETDALSDRAREVLVLLATGATNHEIATAMHISAETVKKHAKSLYRKLGVRNRTEASQRFRELAA